MITFEILNHSMKTYIFGHHASQCLQTTAAADYSYFFLVTHNKR